MQNRERLSSRLGFILLSAGCAIGCGNVWKFPWMAGQYGGGGFVLIYVICLVLLGLPVMVMEFAMGRAAQASPVRMYQKLQKPGQKWHIHGYFALFGNVCLMSFYTCVSGWILYYFYKFLVGQSADLGFKAVTASPGINMLFMLIVVVTGFAVLSFGLQKGLERITKYMMVALLALLAVLAVNSFLLPGAPEGLRFYLLPDFGKITPEVVVGAMNQAFFTLSLGIGSMATVFNNMNGGRLWGSVFFLFMVFASLSTVLAVFENILACVRELTGWSRLKASIVCAIAITLTSTTTALGHNILKFQPFAKGTTWQDLWDFLVSNNLLPLGSLLFVFFCCSRRWGWGWEHFLAEANAGKGLKVKAWMKPIFCWFVPAAILLLYIIGLVNFRWK